MTTRYIKFHAFGSVKGGVGKSTLAVATAKLLAGRGRVPVLLDVDLTGTSLADGLSLCAPRVAVHADGSMDLDAAPTGERLSREQTVALRHRRKITQLDNPLPPPYLNDALLYQVHTPGLDCRVDSMSWQHAQPDGVLYWPSSPLRSDVEASSMMLRGDEHFRWVGRFAWVLEALFLQHTDVTDVVLDLPPGIVGFTYEIMVFLAMLAAKQPLPQEFPNFGQNHWAIAVQSVLVTTPDWNDLLPAIEYLPSAQLDWPKLELRILVNRMNMQSLAELRHELPWRMDPVLSPLGLEGKLEGVDEASALGEIFRRGDLRLKPPEAQRLASVLLREEK